MRIDIRPTPSDQLNGLKAVAGPLVITLTWNMPPISPTYSGAQVFVNTVNDFETATLYATISTNLLDYPVKDAVSRYFWIRAVDAYGRATGLITGPSTAKGSLVGSESIGVFDLATANIIGKLSTGSISGLGALAALSAVDVTQVNNLGRLATANRIYADEIGTGVLAAGVVYAGTINAENINAGTFTGQTYRTATSGKRVVINQSGNNSIQFYAASGNSVCSIGTGAGGSIVANGEGGIPGLDVEAGSLGYAAFFTSNSSLAGINVNGSIVQQANAESANAGIRTNNCVPISSNAYNCGTLSRPWMGVYSSSAPVVTSDARLKMDIENSNLGLEFINALRPVSYRLKESRQEISRGPELEGPLLEGERRTRAVIETPVEGARIHYGLIAQEVRATMLEHGEDNAAFWALEDPSDPESKQALRYEELIGPLMKAVQELSAKVDAQAEEIATLKQARL
jgi:hypothetical protein